jgi:hypothetical protein
MRTKKTIRTSLPGVILLFLLSAIPSRLGAQNWLENLGQHQSFTSKRVSSFDRTGGNDDRLNISPGETVTLAEIEGP